MSGHRGFGGLLRQRNFRLLWIGETTSQLGNAMAAVAMPPLAVDVLHASNFVVASLTASNYLSWLVIGLPVGAWVDRLPVPPLMIIADLLSFLLYVSVPAAYWLDVLTIGQVLVVALLSGACSVVFLTAYYVYLPSLVSTDELIEGNAKLQAGGAATRIGGPGLGGLLSQAIGPATALLFNAASFLVSAACVSGIRATASRPWPRARQPSGKTSQRASGSSCTTASCDLWPSSRLFPISRCRDISRSSWSSWFVRSALPPALPECSWPLAGPEDCSARSALAG